MICSGTGSCLLSGCPSDCQQTCEGVGTCTCSSGC
jgi:hypothetical protein